MGDFWSIIVGFFKFFDVVSLLIRTLQKTPEEKQHEVIARVNAAFQRADAIDPQTGKPSDDVSAIEDIINR